MRYVIFAVQNYVRSNQDHFKNDNNWKLFLLGFLHALFSSDIYYFQKSQESLYKSYLSFPEPKLPSWFGSKCFDVRSKLQYDHEYESQESLVTIQIQDVTLQLHDWITVTSFVPDGCF